METLAYLASQGWKRCASAIGTRDTSPHYSAPWDTSNLYAIPEREAFKIARYALETGRQATPTCAQLQAFELERAKLAHSRMLRRGVA